MSLELEEINRIKREGSEYDAGLINSSAPAPTGNFNDLFDDLQRRHPSHSSLNAPFMSEEWAEYGQSKYDRGLSFMDDVADTGSLNNLRYENQPWYDVLGNVTANFLTTVATTAAEGILGTAIGLINGAIESSQEDGDGFWSGFINNPFSRAMTDIQEAARLTTYKSDAYNKEMQEGRWWNALFSKDAGIFLGENILENAGFTVGMIAAGMATAGMSSLAMAGRTAAIINRFKTAGLADDVITKLLTGRTPHSLGLTGELAKGAKQLQTMQSSAKWIGGIQGSVGEARIEAIHTSDQMMHEGEAHIMSEENQTAMFNDALLTTLESNPHLFVNGQPTQEAISIANALVESKTQQELETVRQSALSTGRMDFALNAPLLILSNQLTWGKMYRPSINGTKAFRNNIARLRADDTEQIVGELGQMSVSQFNRLGTAAKAAVKNMTMEGGQEFLQAGAATSSLYHGRNQYNLNTVNGLGMEVGASGEVSGMLSAITNGFLDNFTDSEAYLQLAVGMVMGGGMVNITGNRSADGKRHLFTGGAVEDYRDARRNHEQLEALTERANALYNDPNTQQLIKGYVQHQALENVKGEAMRAGDVFVSQNAEDIQFLTDLVLFTKMGKTEEFVNTMQGVIKNYQDVLASNNQDDIDAAAADIKEMSKNPGTQVSPYDNMQSAEVVQAVIEHNQSLLAKTENYLTVANNLQATLGDSFAAQDLEEMTIMFAQAEQMETRAANLSTELLEKLNTLKTRGINFKKFQITLDGKEEKLTLAEIVSQYKDGNLSAAEFNNWLLNNPEMENRKYLMNLLRQKQFKNKPIANTVEKFLESLTPEAKTIKDNLVDLAKIEATRAHLINTYNSYVSDAASLRRLMEADEEESTKQQEVVKNESLSDNLRDASSVNEVRDLVAANSTNPDLGNILGKFTKDAQNNPQYNAFIDEYRKINNINKEVDAALDGNLEPALRDGATEVLNNVRDEAETVDEIYDHTFTQAELDAALPNYTATEKAKVKHELETALRKIKANNAKIAAVRNKPVTPPPAPATPAAPKVEPEIPTFGTDATNSLTESESQGQAALDEENSRTPDSKVIVEKGLTIDPNMWNSGLSPIDINEYNRIVNGVKQRHIVRQDDNPNYGTTVKWLRNKGVYEYLDGGKLTVNKEVRFLASQEYWEAIPPSGNYDARVDKPLLLVVEDSNGTEVIDGKNYQIVGTFNEKANPALKAKVLADMNTAGTPKFISTESTKVANVNPGRVEFSTEKSLKGLVPKGQKLHFALGMGNNSVEVPNQPSSNPIYKSSVDGMVYVLIPSAIPGRPIMAGARVKRLNEIADLNASNTLFNMLHQYLDNISSHALDNNRALFDAAFKNLRNLLHVGGKTGLQLHLNNSMQLVIQQPGANGIIVATIDLIDGANNARAAKEVSAEILDVFSKNNVRFNVNKTSLNARSWNLLNSRAYNDVLIEADILSVNITKTNVEGSFFFMNPLDADFNEIEGVQKAQVITATPAPSAKQPAGGTESVTPTTHKYQGVEYTIDNKGVVRSTDGTIITNPTIISSVHIGNWISKQPQEKLDEISVTSKSGTYYVVTKKSGEQVAYSMEDGKLNQLSTNDVVRAWKAKQKAQVKTQPTPTEPEVPTSVETTSQQEEDAEDAIVGFTGLGGGLSSTATPSPANASLAATPTSKASVTTNATPQVTNQPQQPSAPVRKGSSRGKVNKTLAGRTTASQEEVARINKQQKEHQSKECSETASKEQINK